MTQDVVLVPDDSRSLSRLSIGRGKKGLTGHVSEFRRRAAVGCVPVVVAVDPGQNVRHRCEQVVEAPADDDVVIECDAQIREDRSETNALKQVDTRFSSMSIEAHIKFKYMSVSSNQQRQCHLVHLLRIMGNQALYRRGWANCSTGLGRYKNSFYTCILHSTSTML